MCLTPLSLHLLHSEWKFALSVFCMRGGVGARGEIRGSSSPSLVLISSAADEIGVAAVLREMDLTGRSGSDSSNPLIHPPPFFSLPPQVSSSFSFRCISVSFSCSPSLIFHLSVCLRLLFFSFFFFYFFFYVFWGE